MAAEFGPGGLHAGSTPLDVAFANLAVSEAGGPNRGKMIDEWLRFCFMDPEKGSYPWCAAAVSWWCIKGGREIRRSPSVLRLWGANERFAVTEPEPGDVLIMLQKSGKGHCGLFVRALPGDVWESIEGNTNEAGSREGNAVAIKQRPRGYWNTGIFRPPVSA